MPNAQIFLVGPNKETLTPMSETAYAKEDILQTFLARYPQLLPGDQINPEDPRRWLLVAREMPVPGEEAGAGRWSLDHLLLDQDGKPTFVECKRAVDTRARREVVAQMLDYAANGLEYWSLDKLRAAAIDTAQKAGHQLEDDLVRLLNLEEYTEEAGEQFWQTVGNNLKKGQVRLVFVADHVHRDLRRLVEFLNEQMEDVEVLAVEIKQFLGEGHTALVPRVLGLTEAARGKKETGTQSHGGKTTEAEFLAKCSPRAADVFQQMMEHARARGHEVRPGKTFLGVYVQTPQGESDFAIVWVSPPGVEKPMECLIVPFGNWPFADETTRAVCKELKATGLFTEETAMRMRAPCTGTALAKIVPVFDLLLDRVEQLVKGMPVAAGEAT